VRNLVADPGLPPGQGTAGAALKTQAEELSPRGETCVSCHCCPRPKLTWPGRPPRRRRFRLRAVSCHSRAPPADWARPAGMNAKIGRVCAPADYRR
jgi:hypothetical protein